MQINDFIAVTFPQDDSKTYYAIVTKINSADTFECRFVHSGSEYTFKQYSGWLEVVKTTGLFRVGSRTNEVVHFTKSRDAYSTGSNVSVSFDDGKAYLGRVTSPAPSLAIQFLHSGNSYNFDADKVASNGGPYNGRKALDILTYTAGRPLFAGGSRLTQLRFSLKDGRGGDLRGELDIRIKRTDAEEILYSNTGLVAETGTTFDNFDLRADDGQELMLYVDFHPAVLPYESVATSSSVIDRTSFVSGTQLFRFKKDAELGFDVNFMNDVQSVTTTSKREAQQNVYRQVANSLSASGTVSLEGEGGFNLLIAEGKVTAGVSGTVGTGTETTSGSGTTTVEGTETAITYDVYYPRGLEIKMRN
jgi:hypothetical protein